MKKYCVLKANAIIHTKDNRLKKFISGTTRKYSNNKNQKNNCMCILASYIANSPRIISKGNQELSEM